MRHWDSYQRLTRFQDQMQSLWDGQLHLFIGSNFPTIRDTYARICQKMLYVNIFRKAVYNCAFSLIFFLVNYSITNLCQISRIFNYFLLSGHKTNNCVFPLYRHRHAEDHFCTALRVPMVSCAWDPCVEKC